MQKKTGSVITDGSLQSFTLDDKTEEMQKEMQKR